MTEATGLRVDELKPHLKAILDEVRRAGPGASRDARDLIDAEFLEARRAEYGGDTASSSSDSVAMSCAGLYTLSAVALQIYHDTDDVHYLLDAADYYLAAKAQGCNGHD
ncbi:hypothetical protein [Knoellia aerolata]|uniref:Uncharacterized protein n=1 Tax=Knoellia aerolata DSM 18566 TaxID=1385519 RepID=A0A0A0JVI0_9MICO|nr:hypothetical protein [Knoellia aerolata]KGN40709.1 hypothetical protein N801_12815 [Knoellia aerolata DSM 18566]